MSFLLSVWHIVAKRSIANWRLLSTILIGVIVAVAILSSVPLYSNAIGDLGLRSALQNEPIELLDLQVYAPNYNVDHDEFESTTETISGKLPVKLRQMIRQEETWVQCQTFSAYYTDRPTPGGDLQPKGFFSLYSNLDQHINIVDGRPAQSPPANLTREEIKAPDFAIEGMIGSETAEIMNVKVGDRLILRGVSGNTLGEITIELSAIIDPIDPEDEFWFLNSQAFTFPTEILDQQTGGYKQVGPTAPIFITEQTLFDIVPEFFPAIKASYNWFYYVDIDKISSYNAESIKSAILKFEYEISRELPRSGLFTFLDSLISEYMGKLMFYQPPLFLIVFQVAAIILYYLMMVSNMLIDRQAGEISMLRSRGAGTLHIFLIYFIEGLIICVIGAVIGLLLGAFLFGLLGKIGAFQPLTGGEMIPVRFSETVLVLTSSAMLLCLLSLLIPAIQAARRGIVHQRQLTSRPPSKPFWRRFYLDIILLVLGAALYWEVRERGSLFNINITGGLDMDPLLLVTPILLLLAIAIVFLRVFPILTKLATRLSRYFNNAWLALGLWYMERNPVHYTRLILLLVVAISVGMFSATFFGTLERSYDERNIYMCGGDVRLESLNDTRISKKTLEDRYSNIEGVENVGIAYRMPGISATLYSQVEVELLAVDPEQIKEIAWFRKDFDDKSLETLMDILAEDTLKKDGIELPEDAETLGVWVYSPKGNLETDIYARIRDGKGRYTEVKLGTTAPEFEGWQFMEGRLIIAGSSDYLPPPRYLSCLFIRTNPLSRADTSHQSLYFDNLQLDGQNFSSPLIIEDFEDVSEWLVSKDLDPESTVDLKSLLGSIEVNKYTVHNGIYSGIFRWNIQNTSILGIYPSADMSPLTAIASRSYIKSMGIKKNETARVRIMTHDIYVTITEVTDYFATLDPERNGFIIVNLDRLLDVRNRQLEAVTTYPNEVWLTLTDDKELRDSVIDAIDSGYLGAKRLYDKDAMIANMRNNPLAGAAWSGILLIAFLGVILVSSLGFTVYSYLSAQVRKLDFAILRTIGFSLRQIIGLVCFEQLSIIIIGMGLGTIIGERLGYIMMPFIQLTEQGERVLPPFILTIDWGTIGIAYGILFAAFIITISLVVLFFSRVAIHSTLRIGDT